MEVRPTFCRHQNPLIIYHSNFLVWKGLHTTDLSLFGSAPDFLLPPCTVQCKRHTRVFAYHGIFTLPVCRSNFAVVPCRAPDKLGATRSADSLSASSTARAD